MSAWKNSDDYIFSLWVYIKMFIKSVYRKTKLFIFIGFFVTIPSFFHSWNNWTIQNYIDFDIGIDLKTYRRGMKSCEGSSWTIIILRLYSKILISPAKGLAAYRVLQSTKLNFGEYSDNLERHARDNSIIHTSQFSEIVLQNEIYWIAESIIRELVWQELRLH